MSLHVISNLFQWLFSFNVCSFAGLIVVYFLIADMKVFLLLLSSAVEEKNKWEQKGHEPELVVALIKLLLELQVWLELLDLFTAAI